MKLAVDPGGACEPQGAAFDGLLQADPSVLTLTAVEPIAVPLDIVPAECPSPLDLHSNKLLVAINGYEDLDVREIDTASVRMYGVAPLRSQVRDVSAPYFPLRDKEGPGACPTDGRDGAPDLLLVFDARAVVVAIEAMLFRPLGLLDGEVRSVGVVGRFRPEAGGEPFSGEDIVVVRARRGDHHARRWSQSAKRALSQGRIAMGHPIPDATWLLRQVRPRSKAAV